MEKFKVGDKLRIREWDDMVAEFGGMDNRYISTPTFAFPTTMRPLCGCDFTVKSISKTSAMPTYLSEEGVEFEPGMNGVGYWFITEYMLEQRVDDAEMYSQDEILSVLEGDVL